MSTDLIVIYEGIIGGICAGIILRTGQIIAEKIPYRKWRKELLLGILFFGLISLVFYLSIKCNL